MHFDVLGGCAGLVGVARRRTDGFEGVLLFEVEARLGGGEIGGGEGYVGSVGRDGGCVFGSMSVSFGLSRDGEVAFLGECLHAGGYRYNI